MNQINLFVLLSLEPIRKLQKRWWQRKLCIFSQIFNYRSPHIFSNWFRQEHNTSAIVAYPVPSMNQDFFKYFVVKSTINEWNNLTVNIRTSESHGIFKNSILRFIPSTNSFYNSHNRKETKFLQIKACVRYFLSIFYFSLNDSPSKIMKNVFYFI